MALTSQDKKEIEKIVQKELKTFLDTTQAHNIVIKVIQKELGTKKSMTKLKIILWLNNF